MYFGSHSHKNWSAAFLLLLVVATPVFAVTQSIEVAELDLAQAKDSFNEVWHAAAETTKRRTELQENLAEFDTKVGTAKRELEKAFTAKKALAQKMTDKKTLITALRAQLHAAAELRGFYQAFADTHRETFVRFVRYVALRSIARSDTGPVNGRALLHPLLRGSLGESIDDAIAMSALLKARQTLGARARVLIAESQKTEERLHGSASDLDRELASLEGEDRSLSKAVEEHTSFIDTSWKERTLSEAELKDVANEAAETSARLAEMQSSLVMINEQLKKQKLTALQSDLKKQQLRVSELTTKREEFLRKDVAMSLLESAALKAFQQTLAMRNSDKKLYKRIEERSLLLKNATEALERETVDHDDLNVPLRPITDAERTKLQKYIADLTAHLALMNDGVPEDIALQYVDAKHKAAAATETRASIAKELEALKPQFAVVQKSMSAVGVAIDSVEREFALKDLPPLFSWPVRGPISATYFDTDYVKVFGVPHRAIDIAVSQGSIVHSIADGVVFAVRDGGATGFSYVLIGHRNGYASLYGHVSKFLVSKGDLVSLGQPIALSGGTPGTHGAGRMTTGAHVHLEVTKDGEHVNPMSVLK